MARISKSLRFEILARDGFKCSYCGIGASEAVLHVDHRLPKAKGGADDPENLCAACAACNQGKGDRKFLSDGGLSPDTRSARMARIGNSRQASGEHRITSLIDWDSGDTPENGTESYSALVWCDTCKTREVRWMSKEFIDYQFEVTVEGPARPIDPAKWAAF